MAKLITYCNSLSVNHWLIERPGFSCSSDNWLRRHNWNFTEKRPGVERQEIMADQFIGGFLSPTRFPDNMNLFVKLWAFLSVLKVRKITPQSYGNWLFTNHFQWRSIRLRSDNWNFLSVEQTVDFRIQSIGVLALLSDISI